MHGAYFRSAKRSFVSPTKASGDSFFDRLNRPLKHGVSTPRRWIRAPVIALLCLLLSLPAGAAPCISKPPWPNGCSVGIPAWIQQGIDGLFLGVCDNHDQCWGQCNGQNPPYLGLPHKNQCNQILLNELLSACLVTSVLVAFPLGDIGDTVEFLAECEALGLGIWAALSTPATDSVFWCSQVAISMHAP